MTAINTTAATTTPAAAILTAGQKAAATKGSTGHQIAGIKAQLTRAYRLRESLTGYDRGLVTKRINALTADLRAMGGEYDA